MTINQMNKTSIAFLLILIAAGFLLRIYHLGTPSFWADEAISANAAAAMVNHGTPSLPSGFIYLRGILNTFFISLSFMIFGISEFSARLPSVIFGTIMIPLVYLMGVRAGNGKIGLIAALFITFSVVEIAWSRQARMYQQLQFFYLASLYFFHEYFNDQAGKEKSERNLNLAFTILFFIGAVLSHEFGYVLILVFISYFLIANFEGIKKRWMDFAVIRNIIGLFIIIVFLILFILKFMKSNGFDLISDFLANNGIGRVEYIETYFNILKTEFSFFFFFAIFGAILSLRKNRMSRLLLIISFIIPFYILSYYVLLPGTRYLYFIFPILLIFSAYFLDFLIDRVPTYSQHKSKKIGLSFIAIVIIPMLIAIGFSQHVFMIMPKEDFDLGVSAPQADFKKAYNYVKQNMQSNDVVIDSWPAVSLFYMGRSDYWLTSEVYGVSFGINRFLVNNASNEIYANATVIKNVYMLKELVAKNNRGWIVLDNTAWILISPDIKEYIREEMQIEVSDGTIRVYSWGVIGV